MTDWTDVGSLEEVELKDNSQVSGLKKQGDSVVINRDGKYCRRSNSGARDIVFALAVF